MDFIHYGADTSWLLGRIGYKLTEELGLLVDQQSSMFT
jgi:hypothetical protein